MVWVAPSGIAKMGQGGTLPWVPHLKVVPVTLKLQSVFFFWGGGFLNYVNDKIYY